MVLRTVRIKVMPTITWMRTAQHANTLYNVANYIVKKQYRTHNYFTKAYELIHMLRDHPAYKALPAQTAQQILIALEKSWKSYFERRKDPQETNAREPKYKRKGGFHVFYCTNQQLRQQGRWVCFPPTNRGKSAGTCSARD